jgi:dipeptide/tripeptide permease
LLSAAQAHLSPWPGFTAAALSGTALLVAIFKLSESLDRRIAPRSRTHLDLASLREALTIPSVGLLLATLFLANFGFANFEGTLSLALASFLGIERGGYQILLAFAYVGLIQTLVQGGLVRWMANFTGEGVLCTIGATLAILGYVGLALAADPDRGGPKMLMVAASVVVSGLGFIYPSVNALISRRSDPAKQGGILGVGGSMGSLARITGILLAMQLHRIGQTLPFWTAAALMWVALGLVVLAVQRGRDWEPEPEEMMETVRV